jgi:hypothetical protein
MTVHIHFHDAFVEADHPRAKGGSHGGQFVAKGSAEGFVSPNEGNLDFPTALKALKSKQQTKFRELSPEIDRLAGIEESETEPVLGAWKTGAEHSTVTHMRHTTPDRAELALALKGYLTNQLQVLQFVPGKGGEYIASFEAKGTPEEIHDHLLSHNVAFHTLQLKQDGAKVYVYGADQETLQAVADAAKQFDTKIEVLPGKGKFIGTEKEDGTDAEQREDARRIYQRIIDRAVTAGKLRGDFSSKWDDLRDRWRRAATEDRRFRDRKGYNDRPKRIGGRLWLYYVPM